MKIRENSINFQIAELSQIIYQISIKLYNFLEIDCSIVSNALARIRLKFSSICCNFHRKLRYSYLYSYRDRLQNTNAGSSNATIGEAFYEACAISCQLLGHDSELDHNAILEDKLKIPRKTSISVYAKSTNDMFKVRDSKPRKKTRNSVIEFPFFFKSEYSHKFAW